METVENDPDRGMIGAAHDLPGIAVVVDMPSPGQRLVSDAQAARPRPLAQFVEIRGGPVDSAERGRRDVAADQQKIGPKLLHQVEFALGAGETARTLRLAHALEIAERLEGANGEPEIPAEPADLAGARAERQQIVLEDLDRVEARGRDGAQLFIERAAERNGGDGTSSGHAGLRCEAIGPAVSGGFRNFAGFRRHHAVERLAHGGDGRGEARE